MKLFLLKREEGNVDYDEYAGMVVRAETEEHARMIANKLTVDAWDEKLPKDAKVSCEVISYDGESEIILTDFRAG